MVFVIDIGNSNIVSGVKNGNKWVNIWRIQTDSDKTADEYEMLFRSLFISGKNCKTDIEKVVISSVVPALVRIFDEMIKSFLNLDALFVNPEIYNKLPVKILNPYEIGTDLVSNATAAISKYKLPCMVIDFGTALTFLTIGKDRSILGVAIAPGLRTAIKSLAGGTAQLPHVQLTAPPSVLGKNTVHAIQSGVVLGFSGLVNSMVEKTSKEISTEINVVATGGLAELMALHCNTIKSIDTNLTLDGLAKIAELIS